MRASRPRRRDARARTVELLKRFDLLDAADRVPTGFSGGMRRRLDLSASLVVAPPVLLLGEPTTGLDPTSRIEVWRVIRDLVAEGTTLLLTTPYLADADELADRIAVITRGEVVAEGTSVELRRRTGGAHLTVTLTDHHAGGGGAAGGVIAPFVDGAVEVGEGARVLSGADSTRSGLVADVATGAIDRFGTLPIWRPAVLVGRPISDLLSACPWP